MGFAFPAIPVFFIANQFYDRPGIFSDFIFISMFVQIVKKITDNINTGDKKNNKMQNQGVLKFKIKYMRQRNGISKDKLLFCSHSKFERTRATVTNNVVDGTNIPIYTQVNLQVYTTH